MKPIKTIFGVFVSLFIFTQLQAQIIPELSEINNAKKWGIHNRMVSFNEESRAVEFNAQAKEGVVWLKDFEFQNGVIEVDIKGKDQRGLSFVGIAFHGLDEKTFDGIYFRPFNFKVPERKGHSVQYISHPEKTWSYLRTNFPEQYENPVIPVPDPNDWFHARIEINYPSVKVYVNNSITPSLEVEQLSNRKTGWIGLWAGNGSDGSFKNLIINKSK